METKSFVDAKVLIPFCFSKSRQRKKGAFPNEPFSNPIKMSKVKK